MELDTYRDAIFKALLSAKDEKGQPKITEEKALAAVKDFTDEELLDGMPFNSPEEVAEMILE